MLSCLTEHCRPVLAGHWPVTVALALSRSAVLTGFSKLASWLNSSSRLACCLTTADASVWLLVS